MHFGAFLWWYVAFFLRGRMDGMYGFHGTMHLDRKLGEYINSALDLFLMFVWVVRLVLLLVK